MENSVHININGHDISFYNRSEGTRNGFRHVSSMFLDHEHVGCGICNYLNRTWEWYTFQTSMIRAVENRMDERSDRLESIYRRNNNIKRMTAAKRGEFEKILDADSTMQLYRDTIKNLKEVLR